MTEPKRGDRVRIPKGTYIWGTFPLHIKEAKRTYTVEVFDFAPGYPADVRYGTPGMEPNVCWVGAGGYWHHARLEDVEVLP